MPLTPLAETTDLPTVWQGHDDAQKAIDVATAAVRDAAGAAISENTSTVRVHGGRGNLLGLPGPVIDVDSVIIDGSTLNSDDYQALPNGIWRSCGWGRYQCPVTVTYTHGYATVPPDITDLVCQLAVSWLDHMAGGGGSTAGLQSVAIDDARESYTSEAAGQISPVYVPEVTRQWLSRRFGGGAEVVETL